MARTLSLTADLPSLAAQMKPLAILGARAPAAQALVLNRVATRSKQRVIPVLTQQTGLPKRAIVKTVRVLRASARNPRAGLISRGGEISFRFFSAREEGSGVVATIGGERVFVPGGFRRSGREPKRFMVSSLNKGVYVNPSREWRGEIERERTGMFIPEEMVAGATRAAFEKTVATELPTEIARELGKIVPGR